MTELSGAGLVVPRKLRALEQMGPLKLFVVLALVSLVPSASRYEYELSSFAAGLAGVCAGLIVATVFGLLPRPSKGFLKHLIACALITGLAAGHIILTYAQGQPELERPFQSLALMAAMLLSSYVARQAFFREGLALDYSIYALFALFIVLAIAGYLGFAPYSRIASDRPIYPFTEPSHFALAIMPFFVYSVTVANPLWRLSMLAVATAIVLALQSLSLGVGVIIAAVCCLRSTWLTLFLLVAGLILASLDLSYFTDRLDFSYGNDNLSTLVFRQGVEISMIALAETKGWGIGFQRLGFTDLYSVSSNLLYALTGDDLNLRDGGFTAAKLIVELGAIGAILLLGYLYYLMYAILKLRRAALIDATADRGTLFALSCFVGAFVELFVRGAGYFTPTMLLLIAAVPIALQNREKRKSDVAK
ncbi:MAG: hypothetical protein WBA51_08660 [Erythrobacter sp.]